MKPNDFAKWILSSLKHSGGISHIDLLRRIKWAHPYERSSLHLSIFVGFQISNWRVPSISNRDSVLHAIFLLSILIMIICSVATILSFRQSADTLPKVIINIRQIGKTDDKLGPILYSFSILSIKHRRQIHHILAQSLGLILARSSVSSSWDLSLWLSDMCGSRTEGGTKKSIKRVIWF